MSWTRLSDDWCDSIEAADPPLSLAARWHLLQMVQRCSRTQTWDGTIRLGVALRVSDIDDPLAAFTELCDTGHVEVLDDTTVRVIEFAERHHPPTNQRPEAIRERKRRHLERGGNDQNSSQNSSRGVPERFRAQFSPNGLSRDRTGSTYSFPSTPHHTPGSSRPDRPPPPPPRARKRHRHPRRAPQTAGVVRAPTPRRRHQPRHRPRLATHRAGRPHPTRTDPRTHTNRQDQRGGEPS